MTRIFRVEHHGWCKHDSTIGWKFAIESALRCARKSATTADKNAMAQAFGSSKRVWHDGIVFEGRRHG